MRAALLFIVFFLTHVGRSPAEAYSSGPGSCSALTGHGAGSYAADMNYWKLEHDGGSNVIPNDRVVVRLYEPNGCGFLFKGFILKTSAGTLTVKDAMQTKTVSACAGAIGHTSAADKCEVEAYLDLPSTMGTVTVTAEVVYSKMTVTELTLDIEVAQDEKLVASVYDVHSMFWGRYVSMSTDGTRFAFSGNLAAVAFEVDGSSFYDSGGESYVGATRLGGNVDGLVDPGYTASISGDGTRVAISGGTSVHVHEWNPSTQSWPEIWSGNYHGQCVLSRNGNRLFCRSAPAAVSGYVYDIDAGQYDSETLLGSGNSFYIDGTNYHWEAILAISADGSRVASGVHTGSLRSGCYTCYEGLVRVWELSSGPQLSDSTWTQVGDDIVPPSGKAMRFGDALALSDDGTRIVIGSPGYLDLNSGGVQTAGYEEPFVHVYEWSSGAWNQLGNALKHPDNPLQGDFLISFFGRSVSISGDGRYIAVHSPATSTHGRTFIYSWDSSTNDWEQVGAAIKSEPGESYRGSISQSSINCAYAEVSLSGDGKHVAIGGFNFDGSGSSAGRVRVFETAWVDPTASPSPVSIPSPSGSCSSSRATGGTVTTSSEYTIHTFTSSGTFEVTDSTLTAVDALVVGGGGGGVAGGDANDGGGGGGGGAVLSASGMIVSKRDYSITVGDGGNGEISLGTLATYGDSSEFHGLIASGGSIPSPYIDGGDSGSGKSGGSGYHMASGGGGGAGSNGADVINSADESSGGDGGDGIQSDITGTATFYGGGGGGCGDPGNGGVGGQGGGGDGFDKSTGTPATSGVANTRGGGGGGSGLYHEYSGSGGSGVVILRYKSATTCSDDAAEGGGSPSPSAQDKKKQAETTRDSILGDISDTRVKAKAKLLADAAIAGVKVQKLSAKITAADEDTACSETFSKAGMSAGDGACVATAASSGKRRSLSAMAYDVELMFSASTVNDDALKAAELEPKNNGVEGVTSQTSVDPIAELKTVPGVDTNKLQTFETEASAAATAAAEAQTPPPPTPPPPNLVLDDDDGTVGLVGRAGLLMATAFAILAM